MGAKIYITIFYSTYMLKCAHTKESFLHDNWKKPFFILINYLNKDFYLKIYFCKKLENEYFLKWGFSSICSSKYYSIWD